MAQESLDLSLKWIYSPNRLKPSKEYIPLFLSDENNPITSHSFQVCGNRVVFCSEFLVKITKIDNLNNKLDEVYYGRLYRNILYSLFNIVINDKLSNRKNIKVLHGLPLTTPSEINNSNILSQAIDTVFSFDSHVNLLPEIGLLGNFKNFDLLLLIPEDKELDQFNLIIDDVCVTMARLPYSSYSTLPPVMGYKKIKFAKRQTMPDLRIDTFVLEHKE